MKSMGQPQSSEVREGEGQRQIEGAHSVHSAQAEQVPYTKYSHSRPGKESPSTTEKGVTVVNPKPGVELRTTKPVELQKLDNIHRFWPILRSSIDFAQPQERISDGIGYKELMAMCLRYREHLAECANIMGIEQKALASRLKDLEMFSAGIAQQMIRRQERMTRALTHLQKVNEVTATLEKIQATLDHCVPMVQRLNNLLPEEDRLEHFRMNPMPVHVQFKEGEEDDGDEEPR